MRVLWVSLLVVVIDQFCKTRIKLNFNYGESIPVLGKWLRLTFTENAGMAFGITAGGPMFVTFVSVFATGLIFFYLYYLRGSTLGYRTSLALLFGGAMGNIIDRVFYASIYDYGRLFEGRVVDFIHVNVWNGPVPAWVPGIGGQYLSLFPIWNVADMAIVVGVISVLVAQNRIGRPEPTDGVTEAQSATVTPSPESPQSGDSP